MRIEFAHLRERSTTGGWIDFAVFNANANSHRDTDRNRLLHQLTVSARRSGLKIDKAALAYEENGDVMFYGAQDIVSYLSDLGVPQWTHYLDI
jgi:hypothetical protein